MAQRIDPVADQRVAVAARRAAETRAKGAAVADEFIFRRLVGRWGAARVGAGRRDEVSRMTRPELSADLTARNLPRNQDILASRMF